MWDNKRQEQANAEGWRLVTTINNGDTHPLWDIATFGPKFNSDRDASLFAIEQAKRGSGMHQAALQLVANSRMRNPK